MMLRVWMWTCIFYVLFDGNCSTAFDMTRFQPIHDLYAAGKFIPFIEIIGLSDGKLQNPPNANGFLVGFASGTASKVSKELLLHPLDTIKTRLQNKNVTDLNADLFTGLFDGIGSSLIGGIPATSVFFACKDFTMDLLKSYPTVSLPLATGISVCLANIPYWIVRTPSEVAKTRLQLKLSKFNSNISLREKIKNYYRGFLPNVWYSLPSDLLKFVIYEELKLHMFHGSKLEGLDAAVAGALASAASQSLTTPLDVCRIRFIAESKNMQYNLLNVAQDILKTEGASALFSGINPRIARAIVSGAIQFTFYEISRNYLLNLT